MHSITSSKLYGVMMAVLCRKGRKNKGSMKVKWEWTPQVTTTNAPQLTTDSVTPAQSTTNKKTWTHTRIVPPHPTSTTTTTTTTTTTSTNDNSLVMDGYHCGVKASHIALFGIIGQL